jgi:uncharacterized repeat protein (TIGR03803 family)
MRTTETTTGRRIVRLTQNKYWPVFLMCSVAAGVASAATPSYGIKILHSFSGSVSEGTAPTVGRLTQGSDGNFYGVTPTGGANNTGTVFQMKTDGTLTTLHSFLALTIGNFNGPNADGGRPQGMLVEGSDGYFYGAADKGGTNGNGVIFKISPSGDFAVVHTFSALSSSDTNLDGVDPVGITKGNDGNIYGNTYVGGAYGGGVVFRIAPDGSFTTVHNLGTPIGSTIEAFWPNSPVIQASDGNLYGTATGPGTGTVYKVTPQGDYTSLYVMGSQAGDGTFLIGGLAEGDDGALYGTSTIELIYPLIYKVTKTGQYTMLHQSSPLWYFSDNAEGFNYWAGLTKGSDGNFYGVSDEGGAYGLGALFKMTPAGDVTPLYTFGGFSGDVVAPDTDLLLGKDGNLYGMGVGGADGAGAVFELDLPAPAGWGSGTAPTVSMTARPAIVSGGGTFTLSWSTRNASQCALQGVQIDPIYVAARGSMQVTAPTSKGKHSYNLSCMHNGVAGHATPTVTVRP